MRDRITTLDHLFDPGAAAPQDLHALQHGLHRRIADLDARVDALLLLAGPPTDADVAAVDVLCAAIAEAQELLADAVRAAGA